jgi:hypothetical protein
MEFPFFRESPCEVVISDYQAMVLPLFLGRQGQLLPSPDPENEETHFVIQSAVSIEVLCRIL